MAEDHVKIFALTTCPWCRKTIRWFTVERNVPTDIVPVDTLRGREANAVEEEVRRISGGNRYPVTVINGDVIVGFRPEEFAKHLRGYYATAGK
jgi:glutaredoxin